jgi:hypothetical protein
MQEAHLGGGGGGHDHTRVEGGTLE